MVRLMVDGGADELVSSLLWDAGTTGIATDGDQLIAGFATREEADRVEALTRDGDRPWPARVVAVEPVEWAGTDEVTTVVVGRDRGRMRAADAGGGRMAGGEWTG